MSEEKTDQNTQENGPVVPASPLDSQQQQPVNDSQQQPIETKPEEPTFPDNILLSEAGLRSGLPPESKNESSGDWTDDINLHNRHDEVPETPDLTGLFEKEETPKDESQ